MSETRELSDKLKAVQEELRQTRDQLDKQRAQHSREQKALREAIDDTQREATRLRERVEKIEARKREQEGVHSSYPLEAPGGAAGMIVALARPPPSLEEALPVLSRLLRVAPAAVRLRLTRSLPSIMARLSTVEAERLGEQLTAEGFSVVLGDYSKLMNRGMRVRQFTLDEETLSVEDAKGERQQVRYRELRLLVRGRRSSTTVDIEVLPQGRSRREDRSLGAALRIEHEHLENFLWVYGGDTRLVITEETGFTGLGALRAASRAATWQILIEELRKRAPRVILDERFLRTTHLNVPLVPEERGQEVIAALTDEAIKEGMWP